MPVKDSQKRASVKYQKEKTKVMAIRFSPVDMDVLEFAKSQDNMAGYVKGLIRADMSRNQDTQES